MGKINRDSLAQYLRELRRKAGLTQSELSQELAKYEVDVHPGTISGWERAIDTAPFPFGKWKIIMALAAVFRVDAITFFQAAGVPFDVSIEGKSSRELLSEKLAALSDEQLAAALEFVNFLSQRPKPDQK